MLSPTSQTARDRQSRSPFPRSLALFIYLSHISSLTDYHLSAGLFSPRLSQSLRPIRSHSVILSFSEFFFYLNLSAPAHFASCFIIHQLNNLSFFIPFLQPKWKLKFFLYIYLIKMIDLFSSTLYFFSHFFFFLQF